jgi:perosamine synthetase
MLGRLGWLLREVVRRDSADYAGGTTFATDARDVFRRYCRGESLLAGPHVASFEQALREYHGVFDAITFAAGRMALYAILKSMDLREGDEIILPGYTCVVIPNAIRRLRLTPVYVDISDRDFNMVPDAVARAISTRTKAILAQATFGIPCDMDALLDLSRRTGVPVIEDGAHAIGAQWGGRRLGTLAYAAFFSTQATKMLSTEHGGYVVTTDAELSRRVRGIQQEAPFGSVEYERASLLRWCYRAAWLGNPLLQPRLRAAEAVLTKLRVPGATAILRYDAAEYQAAVEGRPFSPYPARMPNLMAYAGLLQLRRLEEDLAHRRRLVAYLEAELPRLGAQVARYDAVRAQPSWVRFPFVVADRAKWTAGLERHGLPRGIWLDDPIHPKGSNWKAAGYTRGQCPVAERLSNHVLNVPVHRRLRLERLKEWIRDCHRLQRRKA